MGADGWNFQYIWTITLPPKWMGLEWVYRLITNLPDKKNFNAFPIFPLKFWFKITGY